MAIAQEDMAVLDFADPQADYAALEQDLDRHSAGVGAPAERDSPQARDAPVLAGATTPI